MNYQQYLNWADQIPWMQYELAGNTAFRWLLALGVGLASVVALWTITGFCRRRLEPGEASAARDWNRAVYQVAQATTRWFLLIVAVYAGSQLLLLPPRVRDGLHAAAVVALLLQAALWGSTLLKFSVARYLEQRRASDPALATTITAIGFAGQVALWTVVLLLALANLGVNVTALVAGLGVGGIAIALAAQNILGDLFSSLSIVLDKPFVLGDSISVDSLSGTVEKIGLKTTHLRSVSGEQLIFANSDLLKSRVRNFNRMTQRRMLFVISVAFETSPEQLAGIPPLIRRLVEAQPQTRFDRSHFKEFGSSGLLFETVYFVLSTDFALSMDVQQAINLGLMEQFAAAGIQFALPTQRLVLDRNLPPEE